MSELPIMNPPKGIVKTTVYIAGPMRGYPRFNFDAFDAAQSHLESLGYRVISPAALDREVGFNPDDEDALRSVNSLMGEGKRRSSWKRRKWGRRSRQRRTRP